MSALRGGPKDGGQSVNLRDVTDPGVLAYLKRVMCTSKIPLGLNEARHMRRVTQSRKQGRNSEKQGAIGYYVCPFCGHYHIGHNRGKAELRRLEKERRERLEDE